MVRSSIRRLLVKYRYPLDKQLEAIRLVIEQVPRDQRHTSCRSSLPANGSRPSLVSHVF
ncbi:MAG TPA: type I restriction enzyme endonuclease domain-containing protein [Aldersonia sp.]